MSRQVMVTAKEFKEFGQHRIYFSGNGKAACWDMLNRKWIKVPNEFGRKSKEEIRAAFGLA